MGGILFKNVYKSYGKTMVVDNLTMSVQQGERLILLGPSGCGKTTTLRMIAGLETVTAGTLEMGGQVVNQVEPGDRNVAMVFQSYALYPHMTVRDNITFGLVMQNMPEAEVDDRAQRALAILNLTGLEHRLPKELSGGQKQRVALARALVKQAPYFLLDEPLSNLDAQLRQQARTELIKIHDLFKPTMIYVTHDQVEAMTIGHRIAVLNRGVLQQLDTPDVIYKYPANTFVASFIGAPPMNLIKGGFQNGLLHIGDSRLEVPSAWQQLLASQSSVYMGIRPEQCILSSEGAITGKVDLVENLGGRRCAHVRLGDGQRLLTVFAGERPIPEGTTGVTFDWEHVNFFDCRTGMNIGRFNAAESSVA
ncbi:transport-associated ob type 2 [Lucifera butyrica]|uniref:Transport-associated ob type 2 n=1 Tax=Lucifera butyrica TaxID=1351585 RepID=A0A498R7Q3_9FIRM|nr:ABC transporter ATP-binding protein [Lucifera butyrica]VBB06950.1 transport-associated ob type 2 [Lucifera butyrica]